MPGAATPSPGHANSSYRPEPALTEITPPPSSSSSSRSRSRAYCPTKLRVLFYNYNRSSRHSALRAYGTYCVFTFGFRTFVQSCQRERAPGAPYRVSYGPRRKGTGNSTRAVPFSRSPNRTRTDARPTLPYIQRTHFFPERRFFISLPILSHVFVPR